MKDHADIDRDTLATVAEITETGNEKGHRILRVKQHDGLAALQLFAPVMGMLINRQEINGPGGGPVAVDPTIDYSVGIRSRLDEIVKRLPAPTEQPLTIDVTWLSKPSRARFWLPASKLGSVKRSAPSRYCGRGGRAFARAT